MQQSHAGNAKAGRTLMVLALLGGSPAAGQLELVELLPGLGTLVDIAHAGDDRLFLARQQGEILVWDGVGAPTTFLDLSAQVEGGFEGGIKSVAFSPDHATDGFFFVHYSDVLGDSVVARFETMPGDPDLGDPGSEAILLFVDQTTTLHRGGQLAFGPDGMLWMGFGDGGPQTDPDCHAQRTDTLQGKLVRLDVTQSLDTPPHYVVPPDNPFVGAGTYAEEVWAVGLRQPWRFSFDRATGDLYVADVGQVAREEVDFEPAGDPGGRNYGWRVMEGFSCHDPDPVDADCPKGTPSCGDPAYTPPVLDYDRSGGNCSITGGFVYRGSEIAALAGRYLYGDWCTGNLWATSAAEGWTSELLPVALPGLTTFGEDVDGELYLSDGQSLFRLGPGPGIFADGFETGDLSAWGQ